MEQITASKSTEGKAEVELVGVRQAIIINPEISMHVINSLISLELDMLH